MFARYDYAAGSTIANVLSDIGALITGETTKANLSSACVQANTYINSTVAAGWTLYDSAAGTNAKAYRAVNVDAASYKYIVVDGNTSNTLYLKLYESWNSSTHVGTNFASITSTQPVSLTNGGILFIAASERHLVVQTYVNGAWGDSYTWPIIIAEISREDPWDTATYGIPPVVVPYSNSFVNYPGYPIAYRPKIQNLASYGSFTTGANAFSPIVSYFGNANLASNPYRATTPNQMGMDADFNRVHYLAPLYVCDGFANSSSTVATYLGGKLLGGLYATTRGYGNVGDRLTYGGNEYFLFGATNTTYPIRLAVPWY